MMSPRQNRKNNASIQDRNENMQNSPFSPNKPGNMFINRRSNSRRTEADPCKELPLDLYNRKRRKSCDRRNKNKTLADDYYSFTGRK